MWYGRRVADLTHGPLVFKEAAVPLVKVIRKGITPAISKVPTSTCAIVTPMTLERVGKEAASENEEPTKIEDVADAFTKFEPTLQFKGTAGPEETRFEAEFRF